MNILYISFVDVLTKTGNHLREIQMLNFLSRRFKITYLNINSKNSNILDYKTENFLPIEIFQASRFFKIYMRFMFKLNYLLNYLFCTKLNLYNNYKFFFNVNLGPLDSFNKIFCFYSIPYHFFKLSSYNTKQIFIDTNDVMLNRHNLLKTKVWWSFGQKKESQIIQKNTFLIYISSNDKKYYEKKLNFIHKSVLIPFALPKKDVFRIKTNEKTTIGFIGSNNPFNLYSLYEILALSKKNHQYRFVIAGSVTNNIDISMSMNVNIFSDKSGSKEFLNEFYSSIDLVYAPAHNKSGIKTKIIEGLSYGIPVLTNLNGYDNSLSILKNRGLFVIEPNSSFNKIVSKALESEPKKTYLKYIKKVNEHINEINF